MNKKITYLITIISLILSCSFGVRAQSMETLKKQRMEIQERINETNKLLKETQKNEKASLKKLNALKKNLNERRNLIKNSNNTQAAKYEELHKRILAQKTALQKNSSLAKIPDYVVKIKQLILEDASRNRIEKVQ